MNDLLARHGLVPKRRRRRPHLHPGVVPPTTVEPNDLWTADFKGQFRTCDGISCYPLTIADQHTRYLLTSHGLPSTRGAEARRIFERAFRIYGLPRAIRTDHGVPFAATASTASPNSTSGGCGSAFSISGFTQAGPHRTAPTSGGTRR